ncbi:MAG TPA: BTAD domain-containing putative transcriptional regulator [Pseudonocardiaceae bacterium]|nr:BTAD domain-containing putative transcriptional regulator [Pseudonocardiaceae bacterium]
MEFRVLGPLEIWAGGNQLHLPGAKRQIVLSSLLLADGKPVPLSKLIDSVWNGAAPTTADKQIRNAISDLRRILSDVTLDITPLGEGYRLDVGDSRLDATEFANWSARARQLRRSGHVIDAIRAYRNGLSLWHGPALAGLDSTSLQTQAADLNQQRLAALEECVDLELAQGAHESLVSELSGWVAKHPLQERLVARLMLALARSGAPARALTLYEQTRQILKNELGASPSSELQSLHRLLLVNDHTVAAAPHPATLRNGLPAICNHFTGRAEELRQLTNALSTHHSASPVTPAVITIDGMAGIGKTAFALRAALQIAFRCPDAQVAIDLHAHSSGQRVVDPASALATLITAMGVPSDQIPSSLDERTIFWRYCLAGRRVLVLVDDAVDTDHVRPLIPGSPGCLTIVTSRRRLTGLNFTHQLTLGGLMPAEAHGLFASIVEDARPDNEPEAVAEVLEYCGYHPLGVRLAATRLRHRPTWTVADLATRLRESGHRLRELDTGDASITDSMYQSYRYLTADHQRLFRLLGTCPDPDVRLERAAAVVGLPLKRTEYLLEGLVEAHLLQPTVPGCYHMHQLVRAYSAQLTFTYGRVKRVDDTREPATCGGPGSAPNDCGDVVLEAGSIPAKCGVLVSPGDLTDHRAAGDNVTDRD